VSSKPTGETLLGLPIFESDELTTEERQRPTTALVCGSFGSRFLTIGADVTLEELAKMDPKLGREMRRRGWIP